MRKDRYARQNWENRNHGRVDIDITWKIIGNLSVCVKPRSIRIAIWSVLCGFDSRPVSKDFTSMFCMLSRTLSPVLPVTHDRGPVGVLGSLSLLWLVCDGVWTRGGKAGGGAGLA